MGLGRRRNDVLHDSGEGVHSGEFQQGRAGHALLLNPYLAEHINQVSERRTHKLDIHLAQDVQPRTTEGRRLAEHAKPSLTEPA
ncbi:hypothetical protein GCM10020216_082860 [Nonomuraea helvata]